MLEPMADEGLSDRLRRGRDEARGLGEEAAGIAADLRGLLQSEIALARAEMREQVSTLVQVAIWGGVALATALIASVFVFITVMAVLDTFLAHWAAALVTTVLVSAISGTAAWVAYGRVKSLTVVPRKTISSVREDVRWARGQLQSSPISSGSGRP